MAPSSVREVPPQVVEVAVTHATTTGDFLDLVLADDEFLHGEFDAIVAAGWSGCSPRWPTSRGGRWWPREPAADLRTGNRCGPRDALATHGVVAHQRGPPP